MTNSKIIYFPIIPKTKKPACLWKHLKTSVSCDTGWRAMKCGKVSGVTVIDVDLHKEGQIDDLTLDWLKDNWKYLFKTKVVKTQSNNYHFIFRYTDRIPKTIHMKDPNIDVQTNGAYVLAEGTPNYIPFNDKEIIEMAEPLIKQFESNCEGEREKGEKINNLDIKGYSTIKKMYGDLDMTPYSSVIWFGPLKRCKCPAGRTHKTQNTYLKYHKEKKSWFEQCSDPDCVDVRLDVTVDDFPDEFCDVYFNSLREYGKCKRYFERHHTFIKNPPTYLMQFISPEGKEDITLFKPSQFSRVYEHLQYDKYNKKGEKGEKGEKGVKSYSLVWMKDPLKRMKKGIIFAPNTLNTSYYNLFDGFEFDKIKTTQPTNYLNYVWDLMRSLTGYDEIGFEKFKVFLADIIQRPEKKKLCKTLLFRGEQGTGKSCFFEWFGNRVLGSKYFHITSNISDYTGRFATGLENKLMCVIEEMSGKDGFANSEILKDLISRTTVRLERKGIDVCQIKNLARFIMLTNNTVPVKIEQSDRRYEPFETSSKYRGDTEYWEHINEVVFKDVATVMEFVDELKKIDLNKYVWVDHDNEIKDELQKKSILMRFFIDFTSDICFVVNDGHVEKEVIYSSKVLYQKYKEYVDRDENGRVDFSASKFSREIKKFEKRHQFAGLILKVKDKQNFYRISKERLYKDLVKHNKTMY